MGNLTRGFRWDDEDKIEARYSHKVTAYGSGSVDGDQEESGATSHGGTDSNSNANAIDASAIANALGLTQDQRQANIDANAIRDAHEAAAELGNRGGGEGVYAMAQCAASGGTWVGDLSGGHCEMPKPVVEAPAPGPSGPSNSTEGFLPGSIIPTQNSTIAAQQPGTTASIMGDTYSAGIDWRPISSDGQGGIQQENPLVTQGNWMHQVNPYYQQYNDPGIYVTNQGLLSSNPQSSTSYNPYSLLG